MPSGADQLGRRRGKYSGPSLPEHDEREAAFLKKVQQLADGYVAIVKDAFGDGREKEGAAGVALHLAQLETHLSELMSLGARGKLSAEEVRAVPALSKEIRQLRSDLGIPGLVDADGNPIIEDNEDDELLDD